MSPPDADSFAVNGAPRGLSILGATGSIGTQTLDIVRLFPDRLRVRALTGHRNAELLARQALEFRPDCVVIGEAAEGGGAAIEGVGEGIVKGLKSLFGN